MKQLKVFFLILLITAGNCQNNHGAIDVGDPIPDRNPLRETRSLDGTWKIIFDHQNEGREKSWHQEQVFANLDQSRMMGYELNSTLVDMRKIKYLKLKGYQKYEMARFYKENMRLMLYFCYL